MINFNVPPFAGKELEYIRQAVESGKISGDGLFTKKCSDWMSEAYGLRHVLLTTSCTHALEMAAVLSGVQPGDEVILPSYTFVSTADAFVQRGARLVFVDIRPETMNLDERLIEDAITEKTKVIVPVHYAGVGCAMDEIMEIAGRHGVKVVEDAAQGAGAYYKGRALGSIGDFGCYSFHETKNYSMGEGGAIIINDAKYNDRAEIIREKGTNRSQFFRGQVAKYNWVDYGSSYLPSDLNAAYLLAQLQAADEINKNRLVTWEAYNEAFKPLADRGVIEIPVIPTGCVHNAHMYYIKCKDLNTRQAYINFMKENDILCVFHYVPLHSAPAGLKFGRFVGIDEHTTSDSDRLVRLPLYYNILKKDLKFIIDKTLEFFS